MGDRGGDSLAQPRELRAEDPLDEILHVVVVGRLHGASDRLGQLRRGGEALLGRPREGAADDRRELGAGGVHQARVRRRGQDLGHDRSVILSVERPLAGQRLEQDGAGREHVGAPVHPLLPYLLRRHVRELPLEDARSRRGHPPFGARDAEVDEARGAIAADEEVLGAHVSVDDLERLAQQILRLVCGV